jgi:hypothetical protein
LNDGIEDEASVLDDRRRGFVTGGFDAQYIQLLAGSGAATVFDGFPVS